jgi:hypothetical protein
MTNCIEPRAEKRRDVFPKPSSADANFRLGNECHQNGDFEQAVSAYRSAVNLNPLDADAWNNLGKTFKELNRLDEAIAAYDCALAVRPGTVVTHCNRAIALLAAGRLEEGWREYEWRWQRFTQRGFRQPLWNGTDIPAETLFIQAEQGFGDAIQFVRFVKLARELAGKVILECHAPLRSLFEHSRCADAFTTVGEAPPAFDRYIPLESLPLVCGVTLDIVSNQMPYLSAPAIEGHPLAHPGHINVGLAWAGNPDHNDNEARSLRLSDLSPLFQVPDVRFFSLQTPVPRGDEQRLSSCSNVVNLNGQLTDFQTTASQMARMDLIISADTAVAHLGGALGKPTWTLIPYAPDWRWLLDRRDSPWYPAMRLFRQSKRGDWQAPVLEAAKQLASFRRHGLQGGQELNQ